VESTNPGFRPAASLTEQIADHIADAIIRGHMAPHERIRELRVARSLGVSRGSVREALLLLERRHLIEIVPRRGAVVADLTRRQLDDLYEVLEALMTLVGRRLAELWDEDDRPAFARALDEIEGGAAAGDPERYSDGCDAFLRQALDLIRNHYLEAMIEAMVPVARRAVFRVAELDPAALHAGAGHWRELLQAVEESDAVAVDAVLRRLFGGYRQALTDAVCH
jgi:DNA-binding GntR family transcriptional regulator